MHHKKCFNKNILIWFTGRCVLTLLVLKIIYINFIPIKKILNDFAAPQKCIQSSVDGRRLI